MADLNGSLPSGYVFEGEVSFHGLVKGNAFVAEGAVLSLHGMVAGDLHVRNGATIHLHGTVSEFVDMDDAEVDVFGSVRGIRHTPASRLWISPDALVDGRRHGTIDLP